VGSLQVHCAPNASFSSQAEPLADVKTLAQYADWMQGMIKMMPDGRYELKSFATDSKRNNVTAYGSSRQRTPAKADRLRPARAPAPIMSTRWISRATKSAT
jgi:hypothetical protein